MLDAQLEQVDAGSTVHLAFEQFQAMDLSFDPSITPGQLQCREDRMLIPPKASSKRG